jgi:hypothetical protein
LADNVNTYRKCLAYFHTRYSNKCHRCESKCWKCSYCFT